MPTVPRYGGPQVATAPLPNVRQPTEVPLESLGAAPQLDLSRLDHALTDEYGREVQKANQIAVTGADAKAAALETKILYDPKTGLLNMRGKNVLNAQDALDNQWKQEVSDIEQDLHNDTQREAFQRSIALRYESVRKTLSSHVNSELEKYDVEQTNSLVTNEINAATAATIKGVSAADAAERSTMAVARARAAMADYADRHGFSPEEKKEKLDLISSQVHAGVIGQMLSNEDTLTAKKYYESFKEDLRGKDSIQLAKSVEEGNIKSDAQQRSDAIYKKHPDDRKAAVDEARKIADPNVRDAAIGYLDHHFNEDRQAEVEDREQAYLAAGNLLDQALRRQPNALVHDVIPANLWSKLTPDQRAGLQRRARAPSENDDNSWLKFISLSPEVVGNMSQAEYDAQYRSRFDETHRTRADSWWEQAQRAKNLGRYDAPKLVSTLTFRQRVLDVLRNTEMIPANLTFERLSKGQAKLVGDFEMEASRRVEEFELTQLGGKRPATGEEVQKIIDNQMRERVYVPSRFGGDKPVQPQVVSQDDQKRAYVPLKNIPAADHRAISQLLRTNGTPITIDRIQRAYAAHIMNNRPLFDSILKERQ